MFLSRDQQSSVLDKVLYGYQKSTEMPDEPKMAFWSDAQIMLEASKQYKAIDQFGNVYLITNPATWPTVERDGMPVKIRPQPILKMQASEALAEFESGDRKTRTVAKAKIINKELTHNI